MILHKDTNQSLNKFFDETSAVGFKYVSDGGSRRQRVFWVIVLLSSFIVVFYQCSILIEVYLQYPTMTVLSYKSRSKVFPSVTVCNNDAISTLNLQKHKDISKPYMKEGHIDNKRLFASVPRDISRNIGHQFKDLILYCSFINDVDCLKKVTSWTLFQTRSAFNCYTFTPFEVENIEIHRLRLTLVLYKEYDSKSFLGGYTDPLNHNIDTSNVMRFTIHQMGEMPDIMYKATAAQTGIKMTVSLKGKKFIRLGKPYGKCELYGSEEFSTYSIFGLEKECEDSYFQKKCNCTFGKHYIPKNGKTLCENESMANTEETFQCMRKQRKEFLKNEPCFSDKMACSDIKYNKVISQYTWPDYESSYKLIKDLVLNYNDTISHLNFYPRELMKNMTEFKAVPLLNLIHILGFDENECVNITYIVSYIWTLFERRPETENNAELVAKANQVYKWIQSSFCKIYVKFPTHLITVSEEKAQIGFTHLLASLGGTVGLWIGWSALTLVEFLSLFAKHCLQITSKNEGNIGTVKVKPSY